MGTCRVVCVILALLAVTAFGQLNCQVDYCEGRLILQSSRAVAAVNSSNVLSDMSVAVGVSEVVNVTLIFDTVVFGVVSSVYRSNASNTVLNIVTQINQVVPTQSVANFKSQYLVTSAKYGYAPVQVPAYLRVENEPDQLIFTILGAVSAVLVVVQFGYGYLHFQGFGFITTQSNERD